MQRADHAPDPAHRHAASQGGGHHHTAMLADFRRRFWVSLGLTVPILLLSPMLQALAGLEGLLAFSGDRYLLLLLATAIYGYGGYPFLSGLREEVVAQRQPGMMTLIGMAITVAYLYSAAVVLGLSGKVFFWELATLIDIMLLGHWIEMRSVMGASGALEALVKLLPAEAHRLSGEGEQTEEVAVDALGSGDRVLVRPGERVPVDGTIRRGESAFNESMITGESRPVTRGKGETVIGGTVNGEGAVVIEVGKVGEEGYLSQVVRMVREAQNSRSRTQDLANRAAAWLTYIALTAGLLTLFGWLAFGQSFDFSLERMVTVMVITCPHALGLAVPLVVAVSTTLSARSGLLIRNRASFERARRLDAVVFDKTGTLTEGRFGVVSIHPLGDSGEEELLRLAAALESQSEHPLAAALVDAAEARDLRWPAAEGFRNLTGRGAEAQVEDQPVAIGGHGLLREKGVSPPQALAEPSGAHTRLFVLRGQQVVGAIDLADRIRPESREAVARLKAMGIRCMMLTGDAEAVAAAVAGELGLDDYFSEVLPEQKAERIKQVRAQGLRVAMVGDGVNDAPALLAADLGVAIGAGTDVAVESADIVLVRSDPRDVAAVMGLARATYSKMVQNLFWATGYNAVAIPLAAGATYSLGFVLSPAVGAALMSLSTVIVAINAQLLRRSGIPGRG